MSEEETEGQEPETEERWIKDKAGRSYRLTIAEVQDLWVLRVFHGRTLVGESNCQRKDQELFLGDLHILNDVKIPEGGLSRFLRFVTGCQKTPVSYRGRGLGRSLLKFIMDRAAERGLRQITGNLFPRDLKENPKLPDWYRQFGFEVTMKNEESGSIRLKLPLRLMRQGNNLV